MYTLISYPAGVVIEGMIVSRGRNRMRVVAAGFSDALELKRRNSRWLTDQGEEVEFEFIASLAAKSSHTIPAPVRSFAAGAYYD